MKEYIMKQGVVLYADGSSRPTNPGYNGWGCHGYFYQATPPKSGIGLSGVVCTNLRYNETKQFSDGEYPVTVTQYIDMFGCTSPGPYGDNVQAELQAVYHGLEYLVDLTKQGTGIDEIQITTDCDYVVLGLNKYSKQWIENNWLSNGKPVKNAELWMSLLGLMTECRDSGIVVRATWTRGHIGEIGNTKADKLAAISANYNMIGKPTTKVTLSEPKGYWKSEVEVHPMIGFKRLYFNSCLTNDVRMQYLVADPGPQVPEDLFGKRLPETSFSIVKFKKDNDTTNILEDVKKYQSELVDNYPDIFSVKLDVLFHRDVYPYIRDHGVCALTLKNKTRTLLTLDKAKITSNHQGNGLTIRALAQFSLLKELLDIYEGTTASSITPSVVQFHDITSLFYEKIDVKGTVKTQLRPEYVVGFRAMKLDIALNLDGESKTIPVPYVLGSDILGRNHLKRLESYQPIIKLVTWMVTDKTMRYATFIETEDAVGVWSNYHASVIYLP